MNVVARTREAVARHWTSCEGVHASGCYCGRNDGLEEGAVLVLSLLTDEASRREATERVGRARCKMPNTYGYDCAEKWAGKHPECAVAALFDWLTGSAA